MSTINRMDIDQLATSQLNSINQRYTTNRRKLIGILQEATKPITINQILESNSDLAQSSVYRNLAVLEQAGLVVRIITNEDHAHYELAEHILDHHHHIICSPCGEILDFHLSAKIEKALEESLQKIADDFGFSIDRHRLDLLGTCGDCTE
ncbi:MAG: transcriptional repressor [Actinomycetota bacterium]|jgi:Fur family ferric uptake transcriptional regulator|nr:MAG: transcriptional repressor [Actinomycetota bacterium]